MRYLIILFLFTSLSCLADDRERAIRHIQKAVLAQPTIVKYRKAATKKAKKMIPKTAEPYLATVGSIGMSAVKGKIETRRIKNLDFDALGGNIRPNVEYNFRENTVNANILFQADF